MDSDDSVVARHLESTDVAGYVDRTLSSSDRARVEKHLAECEECRAEAVAVGRLLRTVPVRRSHLLRVGAAAAAAILLLVLWPRAAEKPVVSPAYREHVITTSIAPVAVAPRGAATDLSRVIWTAVPTADRYRVTLFDSVGHLLWETQTGDTSAVIPATVHLGAKRRFFWKVAARTGWHRWETSDLVDFSPRSGRR